MRDELKRLIATLDTRPGASEEALVTMTEDLGTALPADYLDLLRFSNGAEGSVGSADGSYLILWPAEEIAVANREYGIREDHPELVVFGKDAATAAYAFDTSRRPMPVVEADFVDYEYYERRGDDLLAFLAGLTAP